jgi:hypothetical protein
MRKSDISDPFVRENAVERLCNQFAGRFLVPELYVTSLLRSPASETAKAPRWQSVPLFGRARSSPAAYHTENPSRLCSEGY